MSQLPEFSNDANAEQYIKKHILGQPASQEHAEMTLQAVKRLCEFDGTHWNHAACHLLER